MEVVEIEPEPVLDGPPPLGPDDSCDFNPEFAVICSFIKQFGDKIELELDIEQLKSGLENQESLDDNLIEIHVKLLKKLRRYFVRDQWEKALIRYAYEYSYEHGREIELVGYLKARPSIKLHLLRRLLDAQFECDQKFKALVNNDEAIQLRNQPLGRDIRGNIYWHCEDKEGNLRVYSEEPLDHRSWKVLCKNPTELDNLIAELDKTKDDKIKGEPQTEPYNPYIEIFPEYFIKDEVVDEEEEAEEERQEHRKETKVATKKPAQKGRRGRSSKKSSPLADLPEVEDVKPIVTVKAENDDDNERTIIEPKPESPPTTQQTDRLSQSTTIESQVKQTLDSLISKVATSFDFFFRWNNADCNKEEEKQAKKPNKRTTKRNKFVQEELPRRSSSRIQQLQQRKITEYVEKSAQEKGNPINELKISKATKAAREEIKSNAVFSKPNKPAKKNRQRWKTKGKKKLSWDKDDSDLSSISSLTDSNDESFVEELNGAMNPDAVNDSDEFACEDEETNDAPVILKRVRTARQKVENKENGHLCSESVIEEDKPCGRCDKSNDPDWILLCDMCDDGYHTACCIPPLMFVPDGDWFCLPCEHKTLLSKLVDISSSIKEVLAEKERERQKRQKLRQAFKKAVIKPANDESASEKRNRAKVPDLNLPNAVQDLDEILGESSGQELSDSYRERAYRRPKKKKAKPKPKPARNKRKRRDFTDDEEDEEYEDYNVNRSSRKTYSRRNRADTESEEDAPSSEASDDDSQPKARKARACVSYRFQEYDELIQSAIRADSDDLASANEDPPEEEDEPCNYGRGKDMATIEAIAYQQENGINLDEASVEPVKAEVKEPAKTRKKGRRLNDLDAESEIDIATSDDSFQAASETEEEEEEEEDLTEVDSEDESSIDEIVNIKPSRSRVTKRNMKKKKRRDDYYESDESDDYEPRTRRNASKKVSYKESTDEDDEEFLNQPGKKKKGVLFSDEETDASWHSSANSPAAENHVEDVHTDLDGKSSPEVNQAASPVGIVSTTALPEKLSDKDNLGTGATSPEHPETERNAPIVKKIRLEKRETRPVFTANPLDESIDEIAAPLYEQKPTVKLPPKPKTKQTSAPRPNSANHQVSSTSFQPLGQQVLTQPRLVAPVQNIPALPTLPTHAPMSIPPHPNSNLLPQPHSPYHPAYSQPVYPPHSQYPRPQYYLPPMYPHPPPHFAPGPMPYMMRPAPAGGSMSQPSPIRNPIDELNQYCNRSPYPGNIFNSFNVSHPPKNLPVPNPPFYREDEVRPPANPPSNNKQKSW